MDSGTPALVYSNPLVLHTITFHEHCTDIYRCSILVGLSYKVQFFAESEKEEREIEPQDVRGRREGGKKAN